jgi:hypothetical protein
MAVWTLRLPRRTGTDIRRRRLTSFQRMAEPIGPKRACKIPPLRGLIPTPFLGSPHLDRRNYPAAAVIFCSISSRGKNGGAVRIEFFVGE